MQTPVTTAPVNGNGATPAATTDGTGITTAAQNPTTVIADEQVPLAVQDQGADGQEIKSIEDESVPLAASGTAKDGLKTWWWWLAAAAAAITGKGAYDNQRRKPAKNDADDPSKEEK